MATREREARRNVEESKGPVGELLSDLQRQSWPFLRLHTMSSVCQTQNGSDRQWQEPSLKPAWSQHELSARLKMSPVPPLILSAAWRSQFEDGQLEARPWWQGPPEACLGPCL